MYVKLTNYVPNYHSVRYGISVQTKNPTTTCLLTSTRCRRSILIGLLLGPWDVDIILD